MPRLFLGLDLPQTHRMHLSLIQCGLPGARWVEPADMHITLRFFGDIAPSTADNLVDMLDAQPWPEADIVPADLASFGHGKPTSIHMGIEKTVRLLRLQEQLERTVRRLGFAPEPRKFSPHVTIARCRGVSAEAVAGYLMQKAMPRLPPFTASQLILYSARQSRGGGPYVREEVFALS